MPITEKEIKYCQECIERGFSNPNIASREWQTNLYLCDDCFTARLNNLTNIAPAELAPVINSNELKSGPILDKIYELLGIPPELRFDSVDTVCRNHDKFFNFGAPAIVNKSLEELADEQEQMAMAMFIIKYVKVEPNTYRINQLKEQKREEKNLKGIQDSKEAYSKTGPKGGSSRVKQTDKEKMAKTLGMTIEQYEAMVAKAQAADRLKKMGDFNEMAGNCRCGLEKNHTGDCQPVQ